MAGQGLKYNVDIVMCIDCTGSMGDLLDTVKNNALKFYPDLRARCEDKGKEISELRIRTITFRDFECEGNAAIADTGFLNIPSEEDDFKKFVSELRPVGGEEYGNGLEALAMAINSNWTTGGDKRRHVVVVWSNSSTHPLGVGKSNPIYPPKMPTDFEELTDWWEDNKFGNMSMSTKRLVIFAPNTSAWTEIGMNWINTIHYPSKAGVGIKDEDYETILSIFF